MSSSPILLVAPFLMAVGAMGCSEQDTSQDDDPVYELSPAEAAAPEPDLPPTPAGMPTHLSVGLFSQLHDGWTQSSGVVWDMRYGYFTTGWTGWENSQYLKLYLDECAAQKAIPSIQYYAMNSLLLPGTVQTDPQEPRFYEKVQNKALMTSYFTDVRTLMQTAKTFGKTVLVLVEADGYGYLEGQSGENPDAPAAVASTGLAELKGLPDTVAGWGLAFLALRKAASATNVLLGMHVSGWASGGDILNGNAPGAISTIVATGYKFLAPLGLVANVTGQSYDFLVTDPSDRDADWYKLRGGDTGGLHWWPENAAMTMPSFRRYALWLRAWTDVSRKRWVMWQIPCGNSNSPNTDSVGYKDNRAEYFFSPLSDAGTTSATHRDAFANAGVMALLFGAGTGGQSSYQNDPWIDGKLFIKTYAGQYLLKPLSLPPK